MKYKKQIIIPVVAVSSLAAAAVPVAMATTTNKQEAPRFDASSSLFNVENGVLKGFKPGVTQEQIDQYTKDGVLRLPACKTIGASAFRNVNTPFAKEIVISNETKAIGSYAFYGSEAESVTFEGQGTSILETIGDNAFAHCSSLTGFPFPKTFTKIGKYAFLGCDSFRTFDFSAFVSNPDGKLDEENRELINNIEIGNSAFAGTFLTEPTQDDHFKLIVGDFDEASLGCAVNEYGAKFVLSQFASKLQLKTDVTASKSSLWISGETASETPFDIVTVVPEEYLDIQDHTLVGTTDDAKRMLKFIKYTALQIPEEVTSIDESFWGDEGIVSLKETITDLDLLGSAITVIPTGFMYDVTTSEWKLPVLKNVRLNLGTTEIQDFAFFAGDDEETAGRPSLKWININALNSLAKIGVNAFAGNNQLSSFGQNPAIQGTEEDEQLIIDLGKEIEIHPYCFYGTGIYNIVFKNVGADQTYSNHFIVDTDGEGFYFAGLENLSSIVFDNFVYDAAYESSTTTINFASPDNVSNTIKQLFISDSGQKKTPFVGSFSKEDTTNCFVVVPNWPSESGIEDVFPCADYFKNISKQGVTVNGGMEKSFCDYVNESVTTQEAIYFQDWTFTATTPEEQIEFNPTYDPSYISNVDNENPPQEGQDFTFTVDFNSALDDPYTLDRDSTSIEIEGANGVNRSLKKWILQTDEDGKQATITIPGEYVEGDINATLVAKVRRSQPGDIITNWDVDEPEVKSYSIEDTTLYEGESFNVVGQMQPSYELGELTAIDLDGKPYSLNDLLYTTTGDNYTVTFPGWFNLWTNTTPSFYIHLKIKTTTYNVQPLFDGDAFQESFQPKIQSTINSGETPNISLGGAKLNDGYGYIDYSIGFYNSAHPETKLHEDFTDLYLEEGCIKSKTKLPTYNDSNLIKLSINTGKCHSVTVSEDSDPSVELIEIPEVVFEYKDVQFVVYTPGQEAQGLDLQNSTIDMCDGAGPLPFSSFQEYGFIEIESSYRTKEQVTQWTIRILEAGQIMTTHDMILLFKLVAA